jgi:hypothetical protein
MRITKPTLAPAALAALSLVLSLTLPARPAHADPRKPTKIDVAEGSAYEHAPSGFVFPASVGEFTRVSAWQYDDAGDNVSVGYNHPETMTVATAYVYPADDAEAAEHIEQVKRDVLQVHPDARETSAGDWVLKQGGKTYAGLQAAYTFRDEFAGKERDLNSEAYLVRHGPNFVKFRITYPAEHAEAARSHVAKLFAGLTLPEVKEAPE